MTKLDYQTYRYLAEYIQQNGYSPLKREIASALSIDQEDVQPQMLRLWNQGYLCYPPHITGTIYLTGQELTAPAHPVT